MKRRTKKGERGFVLIAVMLIIIVMVATAAVTLREAGSNIKEAAHGRSRETVRSAMTHGLNVALDQLQLMDPARLADPTQNWDIFGRPAPGVGLPIDGRVQELSYPPRGDQQGTLTIRIGLRPGQRTRAPAGEDVRSSYGQIVEVQLGVSSNRVGGEAEERVAVGVRIPHQTSHSN